ncbi:protein kinase C and casein kinase substrate in neurons protein 1 isoform X2 [Adelges cooleyi]|uniref:protein kinase C and casein kinase substrate in neurons protein 1 isoform X2 n=1 Tax=Adelges cooleyi TaxID=133065 RepID=UPI00217F2D18|nr:protein kinase C and casein kinase substrate in neurons protein 1 isoform X2 [Adelges cooleyi]
MAYISYPLSLRLFQLIINKKKMSHHSDDNMLIASSDSFWEPGNHKRTTKRIEDGYRLCNDLITLIQERSDIEKAYAKSLKGWSKKWNEIIEKGPEYGTTEAAWKGVLVEADRLCDLHVRVKDDLCNDIMQQVKTWQKDNYHKTVLHIKERKEMEESFKKAQKPWCKLLTKVNKTKNDYHIACKAEKSASNQERNASADSSLSMDQVKKMQDRVAKSKEEVQKAKEKYEMTLQELNAYNPKYMEDMTVVFDRCQETEARRLQFFKDTLFTIHKCLNISQDPVLPQIYEEFYHTINNADHEKDLRWWSNNHGVNMAMNWPLFEELHMNNPKVNSKKPAAALPRTNGGTDNHKQSPDKTDAVKSHPITNGGSNSQTPDSNPFEEEEWDEEEGVGPDGALVDNGEPGVPVKALYDYEGAEADELSFKQGDLFEKLEDEDEQGWCKGRKEGRVGLYPANYVETVS